MKKVLSVILAVCLILMTSITAFAADAPSFEKVQEQIDGAVAFLTKDVESFGVDSAIDFCIIADSGADVSEFMDAFIADVKANLDANAGKIISSYGESLETYGAVIVSLIDLGEDPEDFYGYDITEAFFAMDPTVVPATPNYYRYIIQTAFYYDDEGSFLEAVCDTYVDNYYTIGSGVDYYGFSCDNTAYFIEAISYAYYVTDKYDDLLDDAINVLDTYKVDGGYCYNPEYGTEPNADSTALALMAHSSYVGPFETDEDVENYFAVVNGIYADLCTFEGSGTGIFTFDKTEDNAYATKEALIALSYYYWDALMQEDFDGLFEEEEETTTIVTNKTPVKELPTTKAETKTTTPANTTKKSPNTGINTAAVSAAIALFAASGVLTVLKKKEK